MTNDKADVLQGTLDLLILKTLDSMGPQHGYGIAQRLQQISEDLLQLNQGTLYPALLRLEQRGTVGLGGGEAATAMSLLEHGEVEGELLLRRFPLAVAVAERPEQPGDELAQVHQREVSGSPSRRPITAAMRFHSAASRSSCRRPARVRL